MTSSHHRLHLFTLLILVFTSSYLATPAADAIQCPAQCRCESSNGGDGPPTADCSGRQLTDSDLPRLLADLDPSTAVLDLRHNALTDVSSASTAARGFSGESVPRNLSVLLLDNNRIHNVDAHAFSGIRRLRLLSLTNNRLQRVRENAFSQLTGDEAVCSATVMNSNVSTTCAIDLTHNDISLVERHAFAWIKRLDVTLGSGTVPLTVDPYAFYGARWMSRVRISDVPKLSLLPRIFTNTENVGVVEIDNTTIEKLDKFVFEGLNDIKSIAFTDVDIETVESYAFSGIQFHKSASDSDSAKNVSRSQREVSTLRRARYAHSGGQIRFDGCRVRSLKTDAFRDANVAHITLTHCALHDGTRRCALAPHAFRGISGLHTLDILRSQLGRSLPRDSLSSVRGLRRFCLHDVDVATVEPFAFRDVTDVDSFRVQFRSADVTLMTEAFAHVTAVSDLQLRGRKTTTTAAGSTTTVAPTSLHIDLGAFRNLVDVDQMSLVNFRLPVVRRHAFEGLSRVGNLSLINCGVTSIERDAFSDSVTSQVGAIRHFDLGAAGNDLRCECSSTAALQRELERTFTTYRVPCSTAAAAMPNARVVYDDIQQVSARDLCSTSSASCPAHLPSSLASLVLVITLRFATSLRW